MLILSQYRGCLSPNRAWSFLTYSSDSQGASSGRLNKRSKDRGSKEYSFPGQSATLNTFEVWNLRRYVLLLRRSVFCPIPPEELFLVLKEFVDSRWLEIHLPGMSQACSIGLMSGEHVGHSIRVIPSLKIKLFIKLARYGLQLSYIHIASVCQVIYSQFGLAIHQNDHQARRRFVEWSQNEIAVVPDFHKRILFSDEAHFWLNGFVNKQNCLIWSEANSQVYVETPLHPEKLTVWCALWAGGILLQKR
ncbi:hypothetical protein TNCV_4640301 [Trichonephila clavipes]|nr:hypothetical protein TNCV_4640301 [Trichonephila clavipes]